MRFRIITAAAIALSVAIGTVVSAGAASAKAQLQAKTLKLSDMPTGWSVNNSANTSTSGWTGCLAKLQSAAQVKGLTRAGVSYAQGQSVPALQENLISGKYVKKRYNQYVGILNGCKQVSFNSNGTTISGSVGAMSFPTVGDASKAYNMSLSAQGVTVGADIVLVRAGTVGCELIYLDFGTPDPTQLETFVTAALDRIESKTPPPPSS